MVWALTLAACGEEGSGTQGTGGAAAGGSGASGAGGTSKGSGGSASGAPGTGGGSGTGGSSATGGIGGSIGPGGAAGSAGSGGAGQACHDLENTAPMASCQEWTSEPAATGGEIWEGTYHLEVEEESGGVCQSASQTLRFTLSAPNTYTVQSAPSTGYRVTATWTLSGTQGTIVVTCGGSGSGSYGYSFLNNMAVPRLRISRMTSVWTYVFVGS